MGGGELFDEETSIEALYLTPDVVEQRWQVLKALELREAEKVLDVGSGPGLLAYDMAASVGRDGRVCGIDISDDMLTMSRRRCVHQSWAEFKKADATACPMPIIVSMPRYQRRFTNTLRTFRRRSRSFIAWCVLVVVRSFWTLTMTRWLFTRRMRHG